MEVLLAPDALRSLVMHYNATLAYSTFDLVCLGSDYACTKLSHKVVSPCLRELVSLMF